jgi:hypothetical protein
MIIKLEAKLYRRAMDKYEKSLFSISQNNKNEKGKLAYG